MCDFGKRCCVTCLSPVGIVRHCFDPSKQDRLRLEFSATIPWLGEERKRNEGIEVSDAQKAFIIKPGENGTAVAEICRKAGTSAATYFNWKKRYAGLLPTEMKQLKQLEDENGRLRRSWRTSPWTARCCGTSSGESSEAWSSARAGSRDVQRLGGTDPKGLWGHEVRLLDVPLQIPPHGSGCRRKADQVSAKRVCATVTCSPVCPRSEVSSVVVWSFADRLRNSRGVRPSRLVCGR